MNRRHMFVLGVCLLFIGLGSALGSALANNPVPTVNQPLIPASAMPGATGFTLTVRGAGFVSESVVNWNGSPRNTTFIGGSELTASISASDVAIAGTASITVTSPSPGGGTSNVRYFDITIPPQSLLFHLSDAIEGPALEGSLLTGDFNQDGKLDIVGFQDLSSSTNLIILLGKGDSTFAKPAIIKEPRGSGGLVAGDFNGDGILDLAFANVFSNQIFVLLGNGDGTFRSVPPTQMDQNPDLMAVGDFNGDGILDLAVSNTNSNSLSILLGKGDGSFQPPIDILGIAEPASLTVGDFNDDGVLDIAVAQFTSAVSIFTGNGDGTFTVGNTYSTFNPSNSVTTADLNGDGQLDLVVTNVGDSQIGQGDWEIFFGNGDGSFQPGVDHAPSGGFTWAIVADVNGDGKLDVIGSGGPAGPYAGMVAVFPGNGDGTFQAPITYSAGQVPFCVAAGDVNGDGRIDLILETGNIPSSFAVLIQAPASISPTGLNFGKVAVGSTSAPQTVTLTNDGGPTLPISGVTVKGSDARDFSASNGCPSSLATGASCTITVTFTPKVKGQRSANVSVSFGGGAIPQGFLVKGLGE